MSHPQQQSGKKKVEWSTNLSSSEPRSTENDSPEWDSEADHNMLSYFLGANGVTSPPRPAARGNPPAVSDRILQHPFRTDNFQSTSPGRPLAMRQDQLLGLNHADKDLRQPPPTPVIQHYFPSSQKLSTKSSSNNSSTPSGTQVQQPIQQFPFTQQMTYQPQQTQIPIQQPHQQHIQQQQQSQPQIDPVHAMKQNFMGAYHQPATNNHYSFEGYNATMEESISPALEFGGDHEPLLLPGKGGIPTKAPELSSQTIYGMPGGNPAVATATANSTTVQQQQPSVVSNGQPAQIPVPLQFAQPITDPAVATPSFPQPAMGHPAITIPSMVGGNHPFFFPHHLTTAYLMQKAESAEETEEKRAKRLERNRESARKSRRRKKERLSNLEEKVNKLYGKIEKERRLQINSMDTAWKPFEREELLDLKNALEISSSDKREEEKLQNGLLRLLISDVEQSTRKEVVEFQYNTLSQHLLPRYQKFFLWTILQQSSYFLSGKEEHAKREFSEKITMGKISSKQLGEEISSGTKPSRRKKKESEPVSACVSESEKFWPLVCFELSISVEQEERFVETQGRSRQAESLDRNVSQIVAATRLASNAKECILYQIYLAAFRKRKTYNDILTPRQAVLYHEWLLSNKDRVKNRMLERRRKSPLPTKRGGVSSEGSNGVRDEDLTLEELCRCLEESLKISKNLPG